MTTSKRRLAKLERKNRTGERIQYLCYSLPEDTVYKVNPMLEGTGKTMVFQTKESMNAYFDKHKEFELLHIQIVYASKAKQEDKE